MGPTLIVNGWRASLPCLTHSLENPFIALAAASNEEASLIFDYFGSWSETPEQYLIALDGAVQCARTFYLTGTADTDRVHFEPD